VTIDLRDEGPGISPQERALIFEPFYRGEHAADALVKGTGIGLSVVREYVQMHGGTVEALENRGGAHIHITLPVTARVQASPPAVTELAEVQAVK
jgi:two-component system, NtrC family, sensor histidine kinase GlrK